MSSRTRDRRPTPAERVRARQDNALTVPPPILKRDRHQVEELELVVAGRRYPIGRNIDGDTPWQLTIDGAATITIPVRDPAGSLERILDTEAELLEAGARVTVFGAVYVVTDLEHDGEGLYTLTLEDEVAWRLRQFSRFTSATRDTITRAGFVRRLIDEAQAGGRAPIRAFVPELRDRQPIAGGQG